LLIDDLADHEPGDENRRVEGLSIRPARSGDAADLARLAGQLGYPATAGEMEARLGAVLSSPGRAAFVAEAGSAVVGWIVVEDRPLLQSERAAEIEGLVVDEERRRSGVGAALMRGAESWARNRGLTSIRVRSRIARDGAHEFYRGLGFRDVKTSLVFEKRV
jgi:ribosomal protein S18 acetylase RimI-like enzyme